MVNRERELRVGGRELDPAVHTTKLWAWGRGVVHGQAGSAWVKPVVSPSDRRGASVKCEKPASVSMRWARRGNCKPSRRPGVRTH